MNMNFRIALSFVTVASTLLCTPARAQCEDAEAAAKTAASMKAEMARIRSAQEKAFADAFAALDDRAVQLGWAGSQKAAFMASVQRSPDYAMREAYKQVEVATVQGIQQDLKKPEMQVDAVKACQVGAGLLPPMHRIDDLTTQQVRILRDRIAAAQ